MGLFSNNKKYYPIIPIVLPNVSPDKYEKLSEKQILGAIGLYLTNSQRILNDCVQLVNKTENLETFFSRYNTLLEILGNWADISKCTNKYFKDGDPQKDYEKVLEKKYVAEKDAIDRFFDKEKKSIAKLSTEKGKRQRLEKAIETLLKFNDQLSDENKTYILTFKKDNITES